MAAGGIAVGFAFSLSWMFVALGLLAKNAQVASSYAIALTPIAFVSGAFVPVGSMPGWLAPGAHHQPVTVIVEATRGLVLTHCADAANPLLAVAWIAGITLVFAPYAIWLHTRS